MIIIIASYTDNDDDDRISKRDDDDGPLAYGRRGVNKMGDKLNADLNICFAFKGFFYNYMIFKN